MVGLCISVHSDPAKICIAKCLFHRHPDVVRYGRSAAPCLSQGHVQLRRGLYVTVYLALDVWLPLECYVIHRALEMDGLGRRRCPD